MSELTKTYNKIRDIPYHISLAGEVGSDCEDKANAFVKQANSLGFEARLRLGLFEWSSLKLPKEIINITHDPICSHFFVEFKNELDEWVFIDPTWNFELEKANFPISNWDGISSTDLAVPCFRIFSLNEGKKYSDSIDYEKDINDNKDFYLAINNYCDSFLRKEK